MADGFVVREAETEQDDDGIRKTPNGDRIAWFQDPDANVLSLTEIVELWAEAVSGATQDGTSDSPHVESNRALC